MYIIILILIVSVWLVFCNAAGPHSQCRREGPVKVVKHCFDTGSATVVKEGQTEPPYAVHSWCVGPTPCRHIDV